MYKYSVIIPVYNSEKTIDRAIQSILNQTYSDWELIMIDDGSNDNSLSHMSKYRDQRIKIIEQTNYGPGYARNKGISASRGDYICFLDSDDYYENDFLESVDRINLHEKKDIIYVDYISENTTGKRLKTSKIYYQRHCKKNTLIRKQITGIIPWGAVTKVVSLEIGKQCAFTSLDVGEEAIFSLDILKRSTHFGFVKKPKYHYVYNENGQHTKGGLDPWRPVVSDMETYLKNAGMMQEYNRTLNSLALNSLCISLYRCSCIPSLRESISEIKKTFKRYDSNYDLECTDKETISKASQMVFFISKFRLYFIVVLLSRIRRVLC